MARKISRHQNSAKWDLADAAALDREHGNRGGPNRSLCLACEERMLQASSTMRRHHNEVGIDFLGRSCDRFRGLARFRNDQSDFGDARFLEQQLAVVHSLSSPFADSLPDGLGNVDVVVRMQEGKPDRMEKMNRRVIFNRELGRRS